jgi:hypothetical protein
MLKILGNYMKIVFGFIFMFTQSFASPVEVILGQPAYIINDISGGYRPGVNSRVTYELDGYVFKPDGFVYRNDVNIGEQWALIDPALVEMHQVYERLANEKDVDVHVDLQAMQLTAGDGSFSHGLDESLTLDKISKGYAISPRIGDKSIFQNGLEYRSDGKIYKENIPTGGSWAKPFGRGNRGTSFIDGIANFVGSEEGRFTAGLIISVSEYYSSDTSWNKYVDIKRAEALAKVNFAIESNQRYAHQIKHSEVSVINNTKKMLEDVDSYFLNITKYISNQDVDVYVPAFKIINPGKDITDHIKYKYDSQYREKLIKAADNAIKNEDYSRVNHLIEATINSDLGLLDSLDLFTNNGKVLLPEKINPSLGASPLSGLEANWNQESRLGQVTTRVANKIQTSWAIEEGLRYSSKSNILRHLSSYAMFRQGLEISGANEILALNYFKLASLILDTGAGLSDGLFEALESTISSIPLIAQASTNFAIKSIKEEGYLENSFLNFVENIPEIRQAILMSLHDAWDVILSGSAYDRSRLVGNLTMDTMIGFATGGAASVAVRGVKSTKILQKSIGAFKDLSSKVTGIRRSASWFEKNRKYLDEMQHWVDVAGPGSINFHGPASGLTSPLENIPTVQKIKMNDFGIPLPNQTVADTFSGGTYISYKLKKPIKLFRTYNGLAEFRRGKYLTDLPPTGGLQSKIDLALHPVFGNDSSHWAILEIKSGTTVFEGKIANQISAIDARLNDLPFVVDKSLFGGANQYYIQSPIENSKVVNYGSFYK